MSKLSAEENLGERLQTERPHILVGVTSPQTCLVLRDRLWALGSADFRVSLLSAPGRLADEASREQGVAAYAVPMGRTISPLADAVAFWRILRLLRRLKPDIVEFSTPKAGLLGSIAAWICRIRVRIYFLRGLKLETSRGVKRCVLLWAERAASACAHVVLCNSRSLREQAVSLRIARPGKLVLLGDGSSNGVDITRFSPGLSNVREQLGIPEGAPVVGFVGRLTADKGLPELLEAFALILRERADAVLLLVGWFDAAEDAVGRGLRARVEGHPRIIHTGYVGDTSPYYRVMDLLVLPSWREGFPNAVLEATASGIPVVATACTGSSDAVIPEVTGFLVPPGYPEAICEVVLRLIGDPELRLRIGNAARRWAVERYDSRRVLGLTVAFYRQLLNAQSATTEVTERTEAATGLPVSL